MFLLPQAIKYKWPGVKARIDGITITDWNHPTKEKPTQEELDIAIAEYSEYLLIKEQQEDDEKEKQKLIDEKLKDYAIEELKKEGKLDENGNLKKVK